MTDQSLNYQHPCQFLNALLHAIFQQVFATPQNFALEQQVKRESRSDRFMSLVLLNEIKKKENKWLQRTCTIRYPKILRLLALLSREGIYSDTTWQIEGGSSFLLSLEAAQRLALSLLSSP